MRCKTYVKDKRKIYVELPDGLKDFFDCKRTIQDILFEKMRLYKSGKDFEVSLKQLEIMNNNEVKYHKWIFLDSAESEKWNELRELAKKIGVTLKSLIYTFLLDELKNRKV